MRKVCARCGQRAGQLFYLIDSTAQLPIWVCDWCEKAIVASRASARNAEARAAKREQEGVRV